MGVNKILNLLFCRGKSLTVLNQAGILLWIFLDQGGNVLTKLEIETPYFLYLSLQEAKNGILTNTSVLCLTTDLLEFFCINAHLFVC